MSGQLDELLSRSAPTVTGSSAQLDEELCSIAERARQMVREETVVPLRRSRRRGRALLAAGVTVLVLGGGTVAAANSGLDGPWKWWVKDPAGRAVITADGHECQIRWMYEQDPDDEQDATLAVDTAEQYLQALDVQRFADGLDLQVVAEDYVRSNAPAVASGGRAPTTWEASAHGVEQIIDRKVFAELARRDVSALGMLGTSEMHCQEVRR